MATVKPSTWSKLDSNNEFLYKVAFIPARPNLAEDQRYLLAEFGARLCLSRLRRRFTAQQVADLRLTEKEGGDRNLQKVGGERSERLRAGLDSAAGNPRRRS